MAIKPLLNKLKPRALVTTKQMKHQNGSPTFLHRIKIRQALKTKISPDFTTQFGHYEKSSLAEIVFIHLYPLIFLGFFSMISKICPRNSTERLCRIPPTDQPSFKPFTKRIRDVERAKLLESKPQSCAKVVACGVTLKRCQQ